MAYHYNSVELRSFSFQRKRKAMLKSRRTIRPITRKNSLLVEAINIMDKQFEILDEDSAEKEEGGVAEKGFSWPQIFAVLIFTGALTSVPAVFSLILIFGIPSFSALFCVIAIFLIGSIASALGLGQWTRKEELQAIMNHFEGRSVRWYNYAPFILDLVSFSIASFDQILLSPYLPDTSFLPLLNAWAAFYSPDVLVKYVAMSDYVVGALMNSILIIITLLACFNFASRITK
jgi:hypothetical protein